jgi:hypothetical protein
MSTTQLILLAIGVCVICLAALWLAQIKRQRAIERARKTVIYNAQINQLQQIAEATAQILDDQLIKFLAQRILDSAQILRDNKITPDKRSLASTELAASWLNDPTPLRQQAQTSKPESQQKRHTLLRSIIQHIRQAVIEQQISRSEAKQLACATKISKIKLSCEYLQQQAKELNQKGELEQALLQLKKIKSQMKKIEPLPAEFKSYLIETDGQIDQVQQLIKQQNAENESSSGKRLAEEFDKLEEQEQDWQKKQLYDQ